MSERHLKTVMRAREVQKSQEYRKLEVATKDLLNFQKVLQNKEEIMREKEEDLKWKN